MRRDITELIDDIKYESDRLTPLDRLPIIQLKAVLNKMNKLTEKTVILMHYIELLDKKGEFTEQIEDTVQEEENVEETEIIREDNTVVDEIQEEIESQEIEEEIEVSDEFAAETKEEITEEISEEEEVSFEADGSLDDSESGGIPVAEQVQSATEVSKNVEEKLKNMVVTDLSAAIGINEKYLYASELFKGNTEKLAEVLEELNSRQDFKEAEEYMRDLHAEFTWDLENETVRNFIELVERKFNHS